MQYVLCGQPLVRTEAVKHEFSEVGCYRQRRIFIFTQKLHVRLLSFLPYYNLKALVLILCFAPMCAWSQTIPTDTGSITSAVPKRASKSAIKPEERLVLSDSLYYMGIDMSMAKLVSRTAAKGDNYKSDYIKEWADIQKRICKEHNLKYEFSKKKAVCMASLFDSSYLQIDSSWVTDFSKGLTPEQIAAHVKTYAPVSDLQTWLRICIRPNGWTGPWHSDYVWCLYKPDR